MLEQIAHNIERYGRPNSRQVCASRQESLRWARQAADCILAFMKSSSLALAVVATDGRIDSNRHFQIGGVMMRFARPIWPLILLAFIYDPAGATEYRFCVACDTHRAQTKIKSSIVDFGKEWYRVKTAMLFQQAYGAKGCSVSDFYEAECGSLATEELVFYSATGDQVSALISGNPVLMGQTLVEIVVGVPFETYEWIADWFE